MQPLARCLLKESFDVMSGGIDVEQEDPDWTNGDDRYPRSDDDDGEKSACTERSRASSSGEPQRRVHKAPPEETDEERSLSPLPRLRESFQVKEHKAVPKEEQYRSSWRIDCVRFRWIPGPVRIQSKDEP